MRLVQAGHGVAASVPGWPRRVPQVAALMAAGIEVKERWLTADQYPPRSLKRQAVLMFDSCRRLAHRKQFTAWLKKIQPKIYSILMLF